MAGRRGRIGGAAVAALLLAGAVGFGSNPRQIVEREIYLMGTRARLVVSAASREEGLEALDRAVTVIEATETELSTWRDESAVTALNRQSVGSPWHASPRLCATFAKLYHWHAETRGSFDPAIGALTDAWDIHGQGRVPTSLELARAKATSGLHRLRFSRQDCTLTRIANVRIDVGAWGKGEALDRVSEVFGDTAWLVDLGGQVSVGGASSDVEEWPVGVAHPLERDRPWLRLSLHSGSLSTSAGSERDLIVNGQRVAHHLNPRTGKPAAFTGSVSVWHSSGLVADILSTALYVMGPEEGLRWAEKRGLSVCYLIPEADGRVNTWMTAGFKMLLEQRSRSATS